MAGRSAAGSGPLDPSTPLDTTMGFSFIRSGEPAGGISPYMPGLDDYYEEFAVCRGTGVPVLTEILLGQLVTERAVEITVNAHHVAAQLDVAVQVIRR